MNLNPNSNKDFLEKADLSEEKCFPLFLRSLDIKAFRHIKNLKIDFLHPITILSGTNKIGKTSILGLIACSHFEFQMRNPSSGKLERYTWSKLMRFTKHDKQTEDWEYFLDYKNGKQSEKKAAKRSKSTKKWSGVAKKESQIKGRHVVFIDVDRIIPARSCSVMLFQHTQKGTPQSINGDVVAYFEYILEEKNDVKLVAEHLNKKSFAFGETFSSFNSASGEDVLLKIISDAVEAEKKSLILIDELELGLHPKIQRRLVDVLEDISKKDDKQFIITTHSPTLLSSFPQKSRIFVEKISRQLKPISGISVNAAFSKMDSEIYPLVNLFCEDDIAKKIILKAVSEINEIQHINLNRLINIIVSGSASQTFENFTVQKRIFAQLKIKIGCACVLDGDKKEEKTRSGENVYPAQKNLFFLYSREAPEKFLLRCYLESNTNEKLQYHIEQSNAHCLFDKAVEENVSTNITDLFEKLWDHFANTSDGKIFIDELKKFLIDVCKNFSETYPVIE